MKHRFEVLDIFRGLFACLVFLFHLGPFADSRIINNEFINNSDMFVDFFFVLSGFVIAYSYQKIIDYTELKRFLKKRFLRIYPLHIFMLALFVLTEFGKKFLSGFVKINNPNDPDNNIYTFISSLFLLNSTPLFDPQDVSWNIPSWSISAEMIAYIFFAIIMLFIYGLKQQKNKTWFQVAVVLLTATAMISINQNFKIDYTFNYGFLRGILGFFVGILCINVFQKIHPLVSGLNKATFTILEIISVALIIIMISYGQYFKPIGFVYEIIFFVSILIFAVEKGLVSDQLKKIQLLRNLGKYSYSIYMCHAWMISIFNVLFIRILKFPPTAYSYLFVLNFLIIYLFSAWTYKHIELRFSSKKVLQKENAVMN